jgi:mannosyltransferase
LVAIASALAVFHRINFSAWFDETYSFGMATQPLHTMLTRWTWGSESNMVLYYLLLKAWLGLTGLFGIAPNEIILRMPSALAAIGAAVMVYLIGKRLFGPIAGLVAAGLFLMNFLQMILAQMARSYSLELLLLGISWYALFAALDQRGSARRWWIVFIVSSVLSVYAALFSGLILFSQAVALAILLVLPGPWRERVRAAIRPAVLSFLATGVVIAPIAVDAALHGGPVWVPPVNLHSITTLFLFLGGGSRRYELLVFGAAALGMGVALVARPGAGALAAVTRARPEAFGAALAMASWFAVPIAISFALTQPRLNLHLFYSRYLVVVVPPLCLLAGLAVGALRWRIAQALLAVGLFLVAWPQLLHYYPYAQVQDIRSPVQWIEQRYQPGDGLICDPSIQCGIPVEYYLEVDRGPAHFDLASPGRFSWAGDSTVPLDQASVLAYAAQHQRVFLVFAPLGLTPELSAADQQLAASLTSHGHLLDQLTAHADIDTSVVLVQRTP